MKNYTEKLSRFLASLLLIFVLFCCSTSEEDEEAPIQLQGITMTSAVSRAPSESAYQQDVEFFLKVSEKNLKQDISYTWYVEEVEMDIRLPENEDDLTADDYTAATKSGSYFIEKSGNPLDVMISFYKEGFYKVTVVAGNLIETQQKSVIIKVGEPEFPTLQYKFNFPQTDLTADDFAGGFYCSYTGAADDESNDVVTFVPARDIAAGWFDTKIHFNPFSSFSITTGTHVVEYNKSQHIVSLGNNSLLAGVDGLYYDTDKTKMNDILISPVLLKNIKSDWTFKIYRKGSAVWTDGTVRVSSLMWGTDEHDNPVFESVDNVLDSEHTSLTIALHSKFLAKMFIGSMGYKVPNNEYRVYFSPDGIDSNEFDIKKEREYPGLPYGHLIGRLGRTGKTFPIGVGYSYSSIDTTPIYEYSKENGSYRNVTN